MPHGMPGPMMGGGDICDGLNGRYGGGLPGGGSGLGFNLCDFIVWMFAGAAAVGTVAITSFAAASGGDYSPYELHANRYEIYDFGVPNHELPNFESDGQFTFPDGYEIPGGSQPGEDRPQ